MYVFAVDWWIVLWSHGVQQSFEFTPLDHSILAQIMDLAAEFNKTCGSMMFYIIYHMSLEFPQLRMFYPATDQIGTRLRSEMHFRRLNPCPWLRFFFMASFSDSKGPFQLILNWIKASNVDHVWVLIHLWSCFIHYPRCALDFYIHERCGWTMKIWVSSLMVSQLVQSEVT